MLEKASSRSGIASEENTKENPIPPPSPTGHAPSPVSLGSSTGVPQPVWASQDTLTAGGQGLKGKLGSVHGEGDSNPLSMNFLPPQPLFIALKYLPVFLQKPDLPRRGKPSLLRTPLGVRPGEAEADCLTAPFVCRLVSFPLVGEEEPAPSP